MAADLSCAGLQQMYVTEGRSMSAIAAMVGCSPPTVAKRLRACGIQTRSGQFVARPVARELLTELYLAGLPLREIAARLGVSVGTVNNRRRAYDLPRRREATLPAEPPGPGKKNSLHFP